MSPQSKHAAYLIGAGALVAGCVIAVSIGMASLAAERIGVDHTSNGTEKDHVSIIERMPPVIVDLPTPDIVSATALPMPEEIAEPDDFGDDYPTEHVPPYVNDITEQGHPTAPLERWDEDTLECGVNAMPAIDQDEHGNWWAYCEPALVD